LESSVGATMIWQSWWAFLLVIPLLIAAILYVIKRKKRFAAIPLSTLSLAKKLRPSLRSHLLHLPEALKYVSLILVVVALARPQKTDEKINRNVEGIDIMLTLDISHSMLIEDMKPENRLESAKETIRGFIDKRVSDRIGLVVFSGESYTRVPLTLDYEMLKENVAQVETSNNIKMGTAIGVALANAVARLRESTAKSRVIILLTDGENNTGLIDPLTALKIAKGFGIKIYTVGIGKDGQAQLPIYSKDMFGRKIKRYQPIHSAINEDLLKQMARETGGKFYRAVTTQDFEQILGAIDQLEKTKIEENRYTLYTEMFEKYLLWAIIFYFMAILLNLTWLRRGI
jgi:Ca-activated chloride channel homolog